MNETDDDRDHLIDSVRAAVASHAGEDSAEPVPVEQEQHNEAVEMGERVAAQVATEERQRNEQSKNRDTKGRFAASVTDDAENRAVSDETVAHAGPPSSWSPDAKQLYNDLPQPIRDAIAKREDEISRGFDDYRGRTAVHAEIENIIAPRRQHLQQFGFKMTLKL